MSVYRITRIFMDCLPVSLFSSSSLSLRVVDIKSVSQTSTCMKLKQFIQVIQQH